MIPYKRQGEQFPPGVVGLISGNTARFNEFFTCLEALRIPPGSSLQWMQGCNPAKNSNKATKKLLENQDWQWIWYMGDDHTFDPMLLITLLKHNVDVVVPVVCKRCPPFIPIAYKELVFAPGEQLQMTPITWSDLSQLDGLTIVAGAGHAGMLVKRRVIEALGTDHWFRVGEVEPDELAEDLSFCDRLSKAGFTIYLDTNSTMGHIHPTSYIPVRMEDGRWTIEAENTGERLGLRKKVVPELVGATRG